MSLLQEIARQGLAYCEYNQALISVQNLDNAQKMRLINALIDDVCKTVTTKKHKETVPTYIVYYKIQGENYSIRFNTKTSAQVFAHKYNGKVST